MLICTLCVMGAGYDGVAASKYASIIVDQNTGKILYSRNADAPRYPASLTKIMTLYMLFDRLKAGDITLETRLKVSNYAAGRPPSKVGVKAGQTIRVKDAIRALVTKSANDVATVIAENLGETESRFARMMTVRAREIGMPQTTFRNASGLPDKAQVTTARDMATLAQRMMDDHPEYYGYFQLKYFSFRGKRHRNHNSLLFGYRGTDGIKTGYTRASGFNLTVSVQRENKHLVGVVMGGKSARSRDKHMRSLLDRNWKRASSRKLRPAPPSRTPMPARNPLNRTPVPVASAPVHTAAVSPVLPWAPGISLTDSDPRQALASGTPDAPERQGSTQDGDYHVQVGAYSSRSEAVARLGVVQAKAQQVLAGHDPITMPLPKPKRYLFRARFAGFSETAARQTCNALKRRSIPCVVMRAE